jgi:hypothetical protein
MTKDDILRFIKEIYGKLAELHSAIEQFPDTMQASQANPSPESGAEITIPTRSQAMLFVDKTKLRPVVTKSFAEMNIYGESIGAENVQAMIAACGVRPEDNAFSRGIVEMREK